MYKDWVWEGRITQLCWNNW